MGSHYSALLLMDFPQEFDPLQIVERLTLKPSEIAYTGIYNPGTLLEGCTAVVCKCNNMVFLQGRVLFGRNSEADYRECLKEVSTIGRLFHWTVEDTSGTLAFDYIEKGAYLRSWWSCPPSIDINIGTPLPSEISGKFCADQREDYADEWDIVAIAEGFGFNWDGLPETHCITYRPQADKETPVVGKPWWKFW